MPSRHLNAVLRLKKVLAERTAALGSYRRTAMVFALVAGGFWLYVVLASPWLIPEPQTGHFAVLMQALIFVIVFEGMLTAARLTHDAWVKPGHLLLCPVSWKEKAGMLLVMVSLDIKSGVYLLSGSCLITFLAWHGRMTPAVSGLLVFGIAYAITCAWEVLLIFFFHRFLSGKEQQYAQGLLMAWMLSLALLTGFVPETLLAQMPFVSTFREALLAGVAGHTGWFLLQIAILALYILPTLILIPVLDAGKY